MFRKATVNDIDAIASLYNEMHDAEEAGMITTNWKREVYPTRATAEEAVLSEEMFVALLDGQIVAAARINQSFVKEYLQVEWKFEASADEIMTMHTLAVSTKYQKQGLGSRFVEFYERYALENGCRCLRIDTWENNLRARALYKKLGYREAGIVTSYFYGISDFRLVCLEKML